MALAALIWAIADGRAAAALIAAGIAALLGATVAYAPQLLLFAPPVVINAALAVFFGASLLPGREPMIAAYAHLEHGESLPPDLGAPCAQRYLALDACCSRQWRSPP